MNNTLKNVFIYTNLRNNKVKHDLQPHSYAYTDTKILFFVAYIFHCLFSSVKIGFVITFIPFKVFMMMKLTPESSYETVATLPEN